MRDFDGRRIIEPSTWGRLAGKPIAPTAANETRAPPMNMGCNGAAPFPSREETRSEDAQPEASSRVHTSSGSPVRSSPGVPIPAEAATSSGTEVTRRLLMGETRVLSWSDRRRGVTSAVRDSLRFERGGCISGGAARAHAVRISERGSVGLVQTRSCPRSTEQTVERLADQRVWTVMHMEQEAFAALNQP